MTTFLGFESLTMIVCLEINIRNQGRMDQLEVRKGENFN